MRGSVCKAEGHLLAGQLSELERLQLQARVWEPAAKLERRSGTRFQSELDAVISPARSPQRTTTRSPTGLTAWPYTSRRGEDRAPWGPATRGEASVSAAEPEPTGEQQPPRPDRRPDRQRAVSGVSEPGQPRTATPQATAAATPRQPVQRNPLKSASDDGCRTAAPCPTGSRRP